MKEFTFKKIKKKDLDGLIKLISKHAKYEKAEFKKKNKKALLEKQLFKTKELKCILCFYKNKVIAYTTFIKQFSTWNAQYYLYLDCLYIKKMYRNQGLGKKFLELIKKEAKKEKCSQIQWQTPTFNKKAINFYKKNKAKGKDKLRFFLSI